MNTASSESLNEAVLDDSSYREFITLLGPSYSSEAVIELPFSPSNAYYSGFDIVAFLKAMVSKARRLGKKPKDFSREFVAMAFLGALRGNNIEAIRSKSQPEIVSFVNNMVSAYGLVKTATDKTSATLSRFAIACAPDVCKLYKLHDIKPVVDLASEIDEFPNFICYSTFGSLIPTKVPGGELLKLAFL